MAYVGDYTRNGIMPLRHEEYLVDQYEIDERIVQYAGRSKIVKDQDGVARVQFDDGRDDTLADIQLANFWPAETRELSSWAFGWPAVGVPAPLVARQKRVITSGGRGAPAAGTTKLAGGVRPIRNRQWDDDPRYAIKRPSPPPGVPFPEVGDPVLVFSATEEGPQEDVLFPLGGQAIVADHVTPVDFSTWIYDVDGTGKLSDIRKGGLQWLTQVALARSNNPQQTGSGLWGPVLNLIGDPGGATGVGRPPKGPKGNVAGKGLFVEENNVLGHLAHLPDQGGPIMADRSCRLHSYGSATADGTTFQERAGHISTEAFFKRQGDTGLDMPIDFREQFFVRSGHGPIHQAAEIRPDLGQRHTWRRRTLPGKWGVQYWTESRPTVPVVPPPEGKTGVPVRAPGGGGQPPGKRKKPPPGDPPGDPGDPGPPGDPEDPNPGGGEPSRPEDEPPPPEEEPPIIAIGPDPREAEEFEEEWLKKLRKKYPGGLPGDERRDVPTPGIGGYAGSGTGSRPPDAPDDNRNIVGDDIVGDHDDSERDERDSDVVGSISPSIDRDNEPWVAVTLLPVGATNTDRNGSDAERLARDTARAAENAAGNVPSVGSGRPAEAPNEQAAPSYSLVAHPVAPASADRTIPFVAADPYAPPADLHEWHEFNNRPRGPHIQGFYQQGRDGRPKYQPRHRLDTRMQRRVAIGGAFVSIPEVDIYDPRLRDWNPDNAAAQSWGFHEKIKIGIGARPDVDSGELVDGWLLYKGSTPAGNSGGLILDARDAEGTISEELPVVVNSGLLVLAPTTADPPAFVEAGMIHFSSTLDRLVYADVNAVDHLIGSVVTFGASSVAGTTTTRYLFPGGGDASTADTTERSMPIPKAGTLRNMYLYVDAPAGNGNDIVYTLFLNGVSTGLTLTLASTGSSASDTSNTVTVAAGDRISIQVTKAASVGAAPNDVSLSLELV